MQALLEQKDPLALEGLTLTLEATDVILKSLLEEIQIRVRDVESHVVYGDIASMSAASGKLLRLAVQRQTIEKLREGIPSVIIDGDVTKLRGVVG